MSTDDVLKDELEIKVLKQLITRMREDLECRIKELEKLENKSKFNKEKYFYVAKLIGDHPIAITSSYNPYLVREISNQEITKEHLPSDKNTYLVKALTIEDFK